MPGRERQAALEGDVATKAGAAVVAMEGGAGTDFEGEAGVDWAAVELPGEVSAAKAEDGGGAEENAGWLQSDFETG
jgi:hypothetical protein